jgi:MFS family permease
LTAAATGLLVIARPLAFALAAPLAGLVTVRVGERIAGVTGALAVFASMLCWLLVEPGVSSWFLVLTLALSGIGLGIASPAMTAVTASAVDDADLGVVGAMQQLTMQLGSVVGTVVLTAVSQAATRDDLTPYHHAFAIAAVVAGLGVAAATQVRSVPRD